jgi:hypothetical protein
MKNLKPFMLSAMLALGFVAATGTSILGSTPAHAATKNKSCKTYAHWVGSEKVNIVDFTGNDPNNPFKFRLEVNNIVDVPSDGFMGRLARGELTFSYPRKNNPAKPYVKGAAYPAPYVNGPAFGEKVKFQAREIGCNLFEIHWKETHKGDTVTHVQDFSRQQVCTNITNINRTPIPKEFDPFDIDMQMNNKAIFPDGGPVASNDFPFFSLCGKMSQSLKSDRVWEDKLSFMVYTAP